MQPKFQRKKAPPRWFFCQIKRETPLPPERLPPLFTFPLSRGYAFPPFRRSAAAGERDPPGTGDVRHDMACALPPPGGGVKRGRDTKVSLPLLTPQPFLRTRLPSVARLNTRGPQGRLVLQGSALDGSGAFRSTNQTPCTGWFPCPLLTPPNLPLRRDALRSRGETGVTGARFRASVRFWDAVRP